jgi:hypothetical protein
MIHRAQYITRQLSTSKPFWGVKELNPIQGGKETPNYPIHPPRLIQSLWYTMISPIPNATRSKASKTHLKANMQQQTN